MTIEEQRKLLADASGRVVTADPIPSGAHLIRVADVPLPNGWEPSKASILFVAPVGFPVAQPDCFWLAPGPVRLTGGKTPAASNDSNPIPGVAVGSQGPLTWFSWHLQGWDPNYASLLTFFKVIRQRLDPAR